MIRQKNGKISLPEPAVNKRLGSKFLATSMKQAVAQFAHLPQACEAREHAFFPLCSCFGRPAREFERPSHCCGRAVKLFSSTLQRCYPPSTTIFLKPRYRRRKSRCFYCMPQYRPIQSRCIDCMRQYRRIKSR